MLEAGPSNSHTRKYVITIFLQFLVWWWKRSPVINNLPWPLQKGPISQSLEEILFIHFSINDSQNNIFSFGLSDIFNLLWQRMRVFFFLLNRRKGTFCWLCLFTTTIKVLFLLQFVLLSHFLSCQVENWIPCFDVVFVFIRLIFLRCIY